jgi:hypothetical protein
MGNNKKLPWVTKYYIGHLHVKVPNGTHVGAYTAPIQKDIQCECRWLVDVAEHVTCNQGHDTDYSFRKARNVQFFVA